MLAAKRSGVRPAALLLCLVLALTLLPARALAADTGKTVRVGWYESPFNHTDQYGRRSGYAYEFQRKIAAYTGWNYEYVEGSWSELMQMLRRGEIDLMSDVSYKADRTDYALYPSLPMGAETYHIFVPTAGSEITASDPASLNGKRLGVTKDSYQEGLYLEWAARRGVEAELVELTVSEDDAMRMLRRGELDAFLTLDVYGEPEYVKPTFKIGASDFFFVVYKDRQDLLAELEDALNHIQDEDVFYTERLTEKYLSSTVRDVYLDEEEQAWLADHGTIRVGYQDNYLAFCAQDENGQLTGALKDYLEYASTALTNAELHFEAIAYPTASAAMDALSSGEVDCMFPANLNDNDSETRSVVMTPALMTTEMDAVVRASDQKDFIRQKRVTVAVNAGNPNYDMFLLDNYPGWTAVHYQDTPACLDAVAAGGADCIIISNYRFSDIAKQCDKLDLTTVSTGVELDYCFAVRLGDTELYSILARANHAVPDSTVHAALTYYSTENVRTSFLDLVKENMALVVAVICLVMLVILVLLLRGLRAERKASEEHRKVENLNERVFRDALTSVRNKGAYAQYMEELQQKLNNPLTAADLAFAICMFDCDDLKGVNDRHGHDKGDEYLKTASRLICRTFQHSPVFRIGGDEFAVILQNEDYERRDALLERFDRERREISSAAENPWDRVHISMGLAVYDPETDRAAIDVARRADMLMYENKRAAKEARQAAAT